MKKKDRNAIMAILLVALLMVGIVPTSVLAEEQAVPNSAEKCNCLEPCDDLKINEQCPVCGKSDATYTDCGSRIIYRETTYYANGLKDLTNGIYSESGENISVPGEGSTTPSVTIAVNSYPKTVTVTENNEKGIPAGTYQLKGITQSLAANNNVFVNPPAMTDITIPSYPLSGTQEQKDAWETNYGKNREGYVYAVYAPAEPIVPEEQKYTLTVTGGIIGTTGTLTTGEYKEGETVTITANQPEINKRFTKWSMAADSKGTITDSTQSTTTFTMGKGNAAIQADFEIIEVSGTDGNTNLTFTPNEGTELPEGTTLATRDYDPSTEDVLRVIDAYTGKEVRKDVIEFTDITGTSSRKNPCIFDSTKFWNGTIIEYNGEQYVINQGYATNINTGETYHNNWTNKVNNRVVSRYWYNKKVKIDGVIYHCGYQINRDIFLYTDMSAPAGSFVEYKDENGNSFGGTVYLNDLERPESVQNSNYVVIDGTTFKTEILYSADISLVNNGIEVQKPTGTMSIAINNDLTALSPTYVFGAHFDSNGTISTAIYKDNTAQIPVTSTSPFMVIALVEDNFQIPVTKVSANTEPTPTPTTKPTATPTPTAKPIQKTSPKTGDNTEVMVWLLLLLISGTVLTVGMVNRNRKNKISR